MGRRFVGNHLWPMRDNRVSNIFRKMYLGIKTKEMIIKYYVLKRNDLDLIRFKLTVKTYDTFQVF